MSEVNPADKVLKDTNDPIVAAINYDPMFGDVDVQDLSDRLLKEQGAEAQPTNQVDSEDFLSQGIPSPVDGAAARKLKDVSSHHASCIQSKKYSTLGLGFVSDASEVEDSKARQDSSVKATEQKVSSLLTGEAYIESKVDKVLDPLTLYGFMFDFYRTIEDFLDAGTGYLEVIRNEGGKIVGLNWIPYDYIQAAIVKDDNGRSRLVYRYTGGTYLATIDKWYSLFGKENKAWVYDHFYSDSTATIEEVSEVIPFMIPSNRSRYYGYPEWLSASSMVTLLSKAMQYKSDFYTNKGVLSYILSVMGTVDGDKWKQIEECIQGSVGAGNNFKNLAINTPNDKATVQVDKLASTDKTETQFALDMEVFAQHIVSSHRVPPVLANILIPGKLGATNEAVQALVSFQLLVVGPYQTMIQKTLARTLGGKDGIEGLKPEDFRLRSITSQFNIEGLDTIGRAREEAVSADRDFSEGTKD